MSTVPQEFDPSFIAQQSSPDRQIYRAETRSKERSLERVSAR